MPIVYLNNAFLPSEQAFVSVLDRGFLLGDGVYEVIPSYNGHLFRFNEHMRRLQDSLDTIRLANPLTNEQWENVLTELVERNGPGDQSVYFQVTRGAAPLRDHAFPKVVKQTVFAMSTPVTPPPAELANRGVAVITVDDLRWKLCNVKVITLLANVLARQEALDHNCNEAIFVRDGWVTEGAAANIFMVNQGVLITPPKSPFLLPGITRDLVLELAIRNGITCREENFTVAQLTQADEVWLTSSMKEILPVVRVDDTMIGNGKPGPLGQKMRAIYSANKEGLRAGSAL